MRRILIATLFLSAIGCEAPPGLSIYGPPPGVAPPQFVAIENPMLVPVNDGAYVFDVTSDVVDDFFRIEREDRVRQIGDILTEGRIETLWQVSPTVIEPWQNDSGTMYDRVEATFQSIRRRSTVRVIPMQGGYQIDVAVFKELEDVAQPQIGSTGAATFQRSTTVDRGTSTPATEAATVGWIPKGRDPILEQHILAELRNRFSEARGTGGQPF